MPEQPEFKPKFPPEVEKAWKNLIDIKEEQKQAFTKKIMSVVDRAFQSGWKCGVYYGAKEGALAMRQRAAEHCDSVARSKREADSDPGAPDNWNTALRAEANGCNDCAEDLRALHTTDLTLDALGVVIADSDP